MTFKIKIIDLVSKLSLRAMRLFLYCGLLAIAMMMILGAFEVILSVALNFRIPGAKEAIALLMVVTVFSFLPYAFHNKQIVTIDIFASLYTNKMKAIYEAVCCIFGLAIFIPITILTFSVAWRSIKIYEYTGGSLAVPIYPAKIIMFLSSCLLCIQMILGVLKAFQKK
jgi:TRAP-type mannitol/chloroaromatic compound transport system permease small subunit